METDGYRGASRRQKQKNQRKKDQKVSYFRTVCLGGFEESQMICYLWDLVKSMKAVETGEECLSRLEQQMCNRIRVEMRRYFLRERRRNVRLIAYGLIATLGTMVLFGCFLGIDRVSGNSMYPYLNHGDWILYGRVGAKLQRNEVVVFDWNGETLVKRIAGLPGDTVEISSSGRRVIVNGTQVRETYITLTNQNPGTDMDPQEDQFGVPLTVMDRQYLVLGDNRSVSIDSRNENMGTVPKEKIRGRVLLIVRIGR